MKKRISLLLVFIMIITLNSCGKDGSSSESSVAVTEATVNQVILDYGDEQAFEAALNNGDDLVGKTVVFKAGEIHPDSKLGYNIWSGEHLNFVSKDDPGIKVGDSVAVRITKVENMFTDSWVLNYEKVENAVSGDSTIHYDTMKGKATEKELELVSSGRYVQKQAVGDTIYITAYLKIHNPNTDLIAEFPAADVTVYSKDGKVLTTENQVGSQIMPNDTITLCVLVSVYKDDYYDDISMEVVLSCSRYLKQSNTYKGAKTTDFVISNVSSTKGDYSGRITGEITNQFNSELDDVYVSLVLSKGDKVSYVAFTFVSNLGAGQKKAFEFDIPKDIDEYDDISIEAMEWS